MNVCAFGRLTVLLSNSCLGNRKARRGADLKISRVRALGYAYA
jgi:hypothetical protein